RPAENDADEPLRILQRLVGDCWRLCAPSVPAPVFAPSWPTCRCHRQISRTCRFLVWKSTHGDRYVHAVDLSCAEHLDEGGVLVDDLAAALFGREDANALQFLEVDGGGLTFGDAGVNHEGDPAVGPPEDQLDELPGVHLGSLRATAGEGHRRACADQ